MDYAATIKKLNIYEKVCSISEEIGYLQKDDKVGAGQNQYKAISSEKVLTIISEKMVKYGLVVFPIEQEYKRTDETIKGLDYKTKQPVDKINRISDVTTVYKFVNIHKPEEFFTAVAAGTGVDPQDKGIGKAQTYAFKNMLLKVFIIATGDDTDKVHSDDYTKKLKGENSQQQLIDDTKIKLFGEIARTKDKNKVIELLNKYTYKTSKEIEVCKFGQLMEELKKLE